MYTLQLPLKLEKYQKDIINKEFNMANLIYNKLLKLKLKEFKELTKTKQYRQLYESQDWKALNELQKSKGFTKYGFSKAMQQFQHHYRTVIGSQVAKDLAFRLYEAFKGKMLYGNSVFIKQSQEIRTITDRAATEIQFKQDKLTLWWPKHKIKALIEIKTDYEKEALANKVKYCSIKRVLVRGKWKYYILLQIDGIPPLKRKDGVLVHPIGNGDVGIDIGTQTIAITTPTSTRLMELCDKIERHDKAKKELEIKMIKSLNSTNPNCCTTSGTRLKGMRLTIKSNHYKKLVLEHKEMIRKMKAIRKQQHIDYANYIMSLGDKIYVENMNYRSMKQQQRSKRSIKRGVTTSILSKAPSMLLRILDYKLKLYGKELILVDVYDTKASQFNHITGDYSKTTLSDRYKNIGGHLVQRDLYSAFLLMNANDDGKSINVDKCKERFEAFLEAHKIAIIEIENRTYKILSMG